MPASPSSVCRPSGLVDRSCSRIPPAPTLAPRRPPRWPFLCMVFTSGSPHRTATPLAPLNVCAPRSLFPLPFFTRSAPPMCTSTSSRRWLPMAWPSSPFCPEALSLCTVILRVPLPFFCVCPIPHLTFYVAPPPLSSFRVAASPYALPFIFNPFLCKSFFRDYWFAADSYPLRTLYFFSSFLLLARFLQPSPFSTLCFNDFWSPIL